MLEQMLAELITKDFLNEKRFAQEFALGKFKALKWGRMKINSELRRKHVPDSIIQEAVEQIDGARYNQVLSELAQKKWATLSGKKSLKKKAALHRYLYGKGFEGDLIWAIIDKTI